MSLASNLSGATDLALGRDRGLDRIDTSADGFYDSFKGLGIVAVMDGLVLFVTHGTRLRLGDTEMTNAIAYAACMLLIAILSYAASMLALYLLCRTEELQRRFSIAVIAHNWAAPVVSLAFLPPFIVLLLMKSATHPEPSSSLAVVIMFSMLGLLAIIGVRLMRISLQIPLGFAISLFAMTTGVSLIIELWLTRVFGI